MVLLIVNWHLELPQFLAVHQYYDSLNIIIDTLDTRLFGSQHWRYNTVVCPCSQLCLAPCQVSDWNFDILPKYLDENKKQVICSTIQTPVILQLTAIEPHTSHIPSHTSTGGRTRGLMKIPFKINDDIIISNNDKGNDVSNGSEDRSQVFSPLIKYHLIHHCLALLLSELCWNNNN